MQTIKSNPPARPFPHGTGNAQQRGNMLYIYVASGKALWDIFPKGSKFVTAEEIKTAILQK
jgi:hypothetical protein